jgi:hypothetical protein
LPSPGAPETIGGVAPGPAEFPTMTESEAFERLRRENRRWKGLALGACSVVVLIAIAWLVDGSVHRLRAEAQANRALAEAEALRARALAEEARAEAERSLAEAHRAEAAARAEAAERERAAAATRP